jgi:hypothetical protein
MCGCVGVDWWVGGCVYKIEKFRTLSAPLRSNYSKTVWDVFHDLKNVKIAEKKFENRSILANFSQF